MFRKQKKLATALAGSCILAVAMTLPTAALSQNVLLKSNDGTLNLEGDLISFDGEVYVIQTQLGDLRVSAGKVFCEGPGCPTLETIEADVKIAGAEAVAEGLMPLLLAGLATDLGAASQATNSDVEGEVVTELTGSDGFGDYIGAYLVQSKSSDEAFTMLADREIQVGVSSRRILPDEARNLSATGAGNMIDPAQEHIVAVDSLVVVVNRNNTLNSISKEDAEKIYRGEVTNWSQLGGEDLPIIPVVQSEAGANNTFNDYLFGRPADAPASAYEATDSTDAALFVDQNPGAIAYVGFAFRRGQKSLDILSECGISFEPSAFSAKTEEYPLFRRLYMYTRADDDSALASDLVEFATSDASRDVILQAGYTDLTIERVTQGSNSARSIAALEAVEGSFEGDIVFDLVAKMGEYDRLTSTFRFRTGSNKLDERAKLDLERLAKYLEDMPEGTSVTLAGFADNVGAFEPNLDLSQRRADRVREELLRVGGDRLNGITIETAGYGEVAPSACNTNESGRRINRRVETWVKTQ